MYNLDDCRAITLTQPYATLVALGAKQIETRSWRTDWRGTLLIHAGRGLGPVGHRDGLRMLCGREPFYSVLQGALFPDARAGFVGSNQIAHALPLGAIVAICNLVTIVSTNALNRLGYWEWVSPAPEARAYRFDLTPQEYAFGDYAAERRGWLLDDVRKLDEPIACRGARSLWEPEPETLDALRSQLGELVRVAA